MSWYIQIGALKTYISCLCIEHGIQDTIKNQLFYNAWDFYPSCGIRATARVKNFRLYSIFLKKDILKYIIQLQAICIHTNLSENDRIQSLSHHPFASSKWEMLSYSGAASYHDATPDICKWVGWGHF